MSNPIEKAHAKPTLANAIKGQCYYCMGGHQSSSNAGGSIYKGVRECGDTNCPLWTLRPYRKKEQVEQDDKTVSAIGGERGYCQPVDSIVAKAYASPKSRRHCINAKCWDCVGGGADKNPGPKINIRDCSIDHCPIHPVRPFQKILGRGRYRQCS